MHFLLKSSVLALFLAFSQAVMADPALDLTTSVIEPLKKVGILAESIKLIKQEVKGLETVVLFEVQLTGATKPVLISFPLTIRGVAMDAETLKGEFVSKFQRLLQTSLVGFESSSATKEKLKRIQMQLIERGHQLAEFKSNTVVRFNDYPPGKYLDDQIKEHREQVKSILPEIESTEKGGVGLSLPYDPDAALELKTLKESITATELSIKFIETAYSELANGGDMARRVKLKKGSHKLQHLLGLFKNLLQLAQIRQADNFKALEIELLEKQASSLRDRALILGLLLKSLDARATEGKGTANFRLILAELLGPQPFVDVKINEICSDLKVFGIGAELYEMQARMSQHKINPEGGHLEYVFDKSGLVGTAVLDMKTRLELERASLEVKDLPKEVKEGRLMRISQELKILNQQISVFSELLEEVRSARTKVK